MSTTIDQKIVEMRFDNKHFENNVQTSLSTLDKLKQKLHLDGASKGLENVGAAARSVDMSGLSSGVESVQAKFSALQVIGVTALANITNSAVNAGKKIVSALTIDPIKTGLQEYETQINAVQTILANTESKGSTIEDVNKALEELNKYADMTIYNFTEMTRNIGTFTAAGVDLDTSTNAIKGIANLAAVSGSTSQQASTAMYQLSQALASGTVKLMDWNSVVNAGMGGQVFQDALKETARVHGVAIDEMIESEGSFRETLKNEWLTADILTETLQKFTLTTEGLTETQIEANREMLRTKGYTEEQIDEIFKLGNTATEAATKVKTFTQLWDVLQEAAQSGWAQTWKLIIGDYEEAKELLSPIAEVLTNIINKMSDWRNAIVESALGKSFSDIADKLRGALDAISNTTDTVKGAVRAVSDLGDIVNRVIRGEFGNGIDRFNALTAAGYNHYRVQNKVNETLGDSFRHTQEVIDAQDRLLGIQIDSNEATSEAIKNTEKLNTADTLTLLTLMKLSDEQLREKNLTEDQIAALRELESISKKLGIPLAELIDNIDAIDGRWLFWESFKNIGRSIADVFGAIKAAWDGVFGDRLSTDNLAEGLFNLIAAVHRFTRSLRLTDEQSENLTRTFKGIFALVDMISTVMGGAFKFAFEVISKVLQYMNLDILSVTAVIGDAIVGFRDWTRSIVNIDPIIEAIIPHVVAIAKAVGDFFEKLKNSDRVAAFAAKMKEAVAAVGEWISKVDLTPVFEAVSPYIDMASEAIGRFFNAIKNSEFLAILVSRIRETIMAIGDWILGIKDAENVADYIAQGLVNGLRTGAVKAAQAALDLAKALWNSFCEFMGIHSPSTKMAEAGEYVADGLVLGLQNGESGVMAVIKDIGAKMLEFIKNLDFGAIFAGGSVLGTLLIGRKIGNAAENFTAPMDGVGDVLSKFAKKVPKLMNNVSKVVKGFAKVLNGTARALNSFAMQMGAKAILNVAFAIAVLVGSIALLTFLDQDKLKNALTVILGLGVVITGFILALSKLKLTTAIQLGSVAVVLVGIGLSMLILAGAMKMLSGISDDGVKKAGLLLVGLGAIISVLMTMVKLAGPQVGKIGSVMLGITISMLLLLGVIKIAAQMEPKDLIKGGLVVAALGGLISGLILVMSNTRRAGKIGAAILGIAAAMVLMLGVIKLASMMDGKDLLKGLVVAIALGGIIVGLMAATKLFDSGKGKIGATIMGIATAMLMMAIVMRICADLDGAGIAKGLLVITAFGGIVVGLMAATKLVGSHADKIAKTILTMSLAIGILALIAVVLGFIKIEHLAKGVIAVSLLAGMMTLMIQACRGVRKIQNELLVMTAAVAVMAAAIGILSTLDTTGLLAAAGSLALVMGMFALMTKLSGSMVVGKDSITSILIMVGVVAALAGIIYLLANLQVESALASAAAISILLVAMSGSLAIASLMGKNALAGVGAMALMGLVVAELAVILGLMAHFNINPSMDTVLALSTFLLAMSGALVVLGIVGAMGPAAFIGVAALAVLIAGIGGLVVGIGALATEWENMEVFLDKGIPILEKIGYALGSFVGNIIGGFSAGALSGLPEIGTQLSAFMDNAMPFITGVKMVDEDAVTGATNLAKAMVAIIAADFLSDIANLIPNGASLAELGLQLSAFMVNVQPFIEGAKSIDSTAAEGVKALSSALLALTGANALDSLVNWFSGGESSLDSFGRQLPMLGGCIAQFAENLGSFDESKVATIQCASNAIKAMAEAASALPNEGGWLAAIVGENDMETFGTYLPTLGIRLSAFATNLGTFDDDKVSTITCAANAIKVLAEAAGELPNEGGWLAAIVGDNSIETFGTYLPTLGIRLSAFATNLGTFDEDKVNTVTCAANAIKAIADVASELPNEGGWLAAIVGDNSIETFGGYLPGLGTHLSEFATNLGTFNAEKVSTVTSAVNAIKAFAVLADSDLSGANKNISGFGDNLGEFATDISTFAANLPAHDTILAAVGKVRKILGMLNSLLNVDPDAAENFKDSIKDLGDTGVDSFVEAFTSATAKKAVKTAAKDLMDQAIDGVDDKKKAIKTSGKEAAGEAIDGFDSKSGDEKTGAKQAGKDFGSGLVEGIDSKQEAVYNAGYRLGQKAVQGEKDGQKSNSPSKLTIQAGKWLGQGLIVGMNKIGGSVYKAGETLGSTSTEGISSAISRISDAVNTDIDAQPTIRPVLDLSNVKTGASAISGMFKSNPIGVTANVGSINSMMNRRTQNGVNTELISAIDKLRKDLGRTGNTYNSIGGITVEEGSDVSDAIKVIVRAAKVERRV